MIKHNLSDLGKHNLQVPGVAAHMDLLALHQKQLWLYIWPLASLRLIAKRKNFAQIEDFNKQGGKSAEG